MEFVTPSRFALLGHHIPEASDAECPVARRVDGGSPARTMQKEYTIVSPVVGEMLPVLSCLEPIAVELEMWNAAMHHFFRLQAIIAGIVDNKNIINNGIEIGDWRC